MKATLGISLLNIGLVVSSLIAQLVRNPSAMQETWVRSLGWEDALEKGKVFWPGEFRELYIVHGITKNQTQLSHFHCSGDMGSFALEVNFKLMFLKCVFF